MANGTDELTGSRVMVSRLKKARVAANTHLSITHSNSNIKHATKTDVALFVDLNTILGHHAVTGGVELVPLRS